MILYKTAEEALSHSNQICVYSLEYLGIHIAFTNWKTLDNFDSIFFEDESEEEFA